MKKEELILALSEACEGLKSHAIATSFDLAWKAQVARDQKLFASTIMATFVEGIGNYKRFSASAIEVCKNVSIATYYDGGLNDFFLHHLSHAKRSLPKVEQTAGDELRNSFLSKPETLFFIDAHKRLIAAKKLLVDMLHSERPLGELLLEGICSEDGPPLKDLSEILETISELVTAYCESQGIWEPPKIEVTYLDLGSNYQIGVKVDGKAEVGPNIARFLSEIFRWVTNPRAYMRERRAEGIGKEVAIIAELQRRVEAGELTPEVAHQFANRLLNCGKKLADQQVFPASFLRERSTHSPASEVIALNQESVQHPPLRAPDFKQLPNTLATRLELPPPDGSEKPA